MLNEVASRLLQVRSVAKAANHREVVPVEASFAAKIVGAMAEDCGPCTQLVVDMALEAGMPKDQIEAVLRRDPRAMNDATALGVPVCRRGGAPVRRRRRISRRRPRPMGRQRRDRSDDGAANGPDVPDGEGRRLVMPRNAAASWWVDTMSMSSNRPHDDDPLAPHRGRLLGLAYRMLGSRSDAEDVVQDAYLRFAGAQDVHNPEAFLVTVVTRLCLDRLKSAKAQREVYVGPWLPEPVFDAEGLSAGRGDRTGRRSLVRVAAGAGPAVAAGARGLPAARRVRHAILRNRAHARPDRGGLPATGDTGPPCGARRTPRAPATPDNHARLLQAFSEARASGDVSRLAGLLREDAIAMPMAAAARPQRSIRSSAPTRSRASSSALRSKNAGRDIRIEPTMINGNVGALLYMDGEIDHSMSMAIDGERIAAIYIVRNPDKLRQCRLPPTLSSQVRRTGPRAAAVFRRKTLRDWRSRSPASRHATPEYGRRYAGSARRWAAPSAHPAHAAPCANTSRPAPAMVLSVSAATSACWSITEPREMLTT